MALSIISSNLMQKHCARLILFIALFFAVDSGMAVIFKHLYSGIYTGPGRYNYIKENRFDCLIMGSSTSTCYYSDIISKKTGLSTLNVGLDGSALIYSRCLLDLIITHHVQPQMIILNIDLFEIQKSAWSGNFYSRIEQFAPFFGQSDYINKALLKGKHFEFIKYLIASYKYNDMFISIIAKKINCKDREYKRGSSPRTVLKLPVDSKIINEKFSDEISIDQRKLELLNEFISVCKKNNIILIFVESPVYYPEQKMTKRDKKLEEFFLSIATMQNIPFIRITQDTNSVFKSNLLFKDVLHLNDKGSEIFTDILCKEIIQRELLPGNL